jgi:pimeloyl-ACP methyl ester carboxylesterase
LNGGAPRPGEGRLVSLPDADVCVHEQGPADGPPVVLIHGFLTSAYTWREVAGPLARQHRVILLDLPGCGESPDPRASHWTAERGARLLADLCDALGLQAPAIVGSQMGGSLAAWFAAAYPDRLSRLVLIAAGALGEAQANLTVYRLLASPLTGRWLARHFPRRAFEERWQAAHGPGHADPVATGRYFAQLRSRGHVMAKMGLGIRLSYGESFDALAGPISGLAVPTLLIFGEADRLVPPATGRRFQELIPAARLVIIPGCGDFPQEEHPARVSSEILGFLTGTAVPASPPEGPGQRR